MRQSTFIGAIVACVAINAGSASAESISAMRNPSAPQTVADVRGVFAGKCSGCHGPDLVKPRGRFGYVLDLRRIAENPEMVIPSSPDESELWLLVKNGEMPPPDSPRGPLSETQKNIIRAWIADGAQDISPSATAAAPVATTISPIVAAIEPPALVGRKSEATASPPAPFIAREILWFGRFHLLAIHFPIALMIAAGLGELWSACARLRGPFEPVRFCLRLAAIAVLPTLALGWLFAAAGNGAGSHVLPFHRWMGTATGVCIIAAAICCELDHRRGTRGRLFRMLLAAGVLLTVATAHLGGLLAHGTDFYNW